MGLRVHPQTPLTHLNAALDGVQPLPAPSASLHWVCFLYVALASSFSAFFLAASASDPHHLADLAVSAAWMLEECQTRFGYGAMLQLFAAAFGECQRP